MTIFIYENEIETVMNETTGEVDHVIVKCENGEVYKAKEIVSTTSLGKFITVQKRKIEICFRSGKQYLFSKRSDLQCCD